MPRASTLTAVAGYCGGLLAAVGALMIIPGVIAAFLDGSSSSTTVPSFVISGVGTIAAGFVLWRIFGGQPITNARAMLVCSIGWMTAALVSALPYHFGMGCSYLDALFESTAGFTTTGFTVLRGFDGIPRSMIFWRCFTQWLGGLGILTFFLAVSSQAPGAHMLLGAESHKISSSRPVPGMANTLRVFWVIYGGITLLSVTVFLLGGMDVFDAVNHGLTTASTGGFSTKEEGIAWFTQARGMNPWVIQYGLVVCMVLGGTNFLVLFKVLSGSVRSLWNTLEVKLWWSLLSGFTVIVLWEKLVRGVHPTFEEALRSSLFTVVSLMTSTGFVITELSSPLFGPVARHCFMLMLIVGGCVGSTSGGLKVLRVGILLKSAGQEVRRLFNPLRAVSGVRVDGKLVPRAEVHRVSAVFFLWMLLLGIGSMVSTWFTGLEGAQSASIMASTIGNMGPGFIRMGEMASFPAQAKLVYILGMMAGRLEILPLLMLFRRKAWR
ncbi:MAG: TrkH family potassium uptake protein [Candidatus Fermentibacteraceae bacterium]